MFAQSCRLHWSTSSISSCTKHNKPRYLKDVLIWQLTDILVKLLQGILQACSAYDHDGSIWIAPFVAFVHIVVDWHCLAHLEASPTNSPTARIKPQSICHSCIKMQDFCIKLVLMQAVCKCNRLVHPTMVHSRTLTFVCVTRRAGCKLWGVPFTATSFCKHIKHWPYNKHQSICVLTWPVSKAYL